MKEDFCLNHHEHRSRINNLEKSQDTQWRSIGELQNDIKKILWKVGTLVGTISIVQTIIIALVVYYVTGGR